MDELVIVKPCSAQVGAGVGAFSFLDVVFWPPSVRWLEESAWRILWESISRFFTCLGRLGACAFCPGDAGQRFDWDDMEETYRALKVLFEIRICERNIPSNMLLNVSSLKSIKGKGTPEALNLIFKVSYYLVLFFWQCSFYSLILSYQPLLIHGVHVAYEVTGTI